MVKYTEFLGSVTMSPYYFRHYDMSSFALKVNSKQIPTEGLSLGMDHEEMSVMGYRKLFEVSDIHHSKSGTPDKSRHVYKRLFHPTLRLDTRSSHL